MNQDAQPQCLTVLLRPSSPLHERVVVLCADPLMPSPANSLSEIASALHSAQRIAIAAHVRPDGDAVGSVLGLALSLRAAGKTVFALLEDGVPSTLTFLPETITVLQPPYAALEIDCAVAVDTATHERVGEQTGCT